jgi:hypothetical protein
VLLWQGEEVDEQRAVTDSLALSDREDARASARASARVWQSALQSEPHFSPQPLTDTSSHIFRILHYDRSNSGGNAGSGWRG